MMRGRGIVSCVLVALVVSVFAGCSQREKFTLHEYKVRFVGEPGAVATCTLTLVNKGISDVTTFTITSPFEKAYLAEACRVELKTVSQPVRKDFRLELLVDGEKSGSVNGYVGPGASGSCSLSDGLPVKKEAAATEPAAVPAM